MIIDILIVLAAVSSLYRGRQVGFVRQAFSTGGFFGGLFLGAHLQPQVVAMSQDAMTRGLLSALSTVGVAIIGLSVGELIGIFIKTKLQLKRIDHLDQGFGSILALCTLLLSVWLIAALSNSLPLGNLQRQIDKSQIIASLNKSLPDAPTVIANLGKLIDPNGFPDVFAGLEPTPQTNVPVPELGEMKSAVDASRASIVKLVGQGCGGIVDGSGFVIKPGFIATNAHVVAGIRAPRVVDANGSHRGTVVWFDPNLDFAILRVPDLAGKPLPLNTTKAARGTAIAALGYPGGGPFVAQPGAILDQFLASGRNIYDRASASRDVYEIRAKVIPGNSGGPIVAKDGSVVGVVFAESTTYDSVGYALTSASVEKAINQATARNQPVGTGQCTE